MRVIFGTPSIGLHYDLVGPFLHPFIDIHHGCENVDGMGGIHFFDGDFVGCYFFRMILCYFLPKNKSLSFLFFYISSFVVLRFL